MRIIISLFIVGCFIIGCAPLSSGLRDEYDSSSFGLLDEYIDIMQDGNTNLHKALSLAVEVKRVIEQGDSLISFFEDVQKENVSKYEAGIISDIESYLDVSENIKNKIIHFQLEYRNYDLQGLRFMMKIAQSKNHHKMMEQISNIHLDIKDVMFESDYETLASTQAVLIESFLSLEYQIQSQAMQNQMKQWEDDNEWSKKHE